MLPLFVEEGNASGVPIGVAPLSEKGTGTGAGIAGLTGTLSLGGILTRATADGTGVKLRVSGLDSIITFDLLHYGSWLGASSATGEGVCFGESLRSNHPTKWALRTGNRLLTVRRAISLNASPK